jgi:hypothetical protein
VVLVDEAVIIICFSFSLSPSVDDSIVDERASDFVSGVKIISDEERSDSTEKITPPAIISPKNRKSTFLTFFIRPEDGNICLLSRRGGGDGFLAGETGICLIDRSLGGITS